MIGRIFGGQKRKRDSSSRECAVLEPRLISPEEVKKHRGVKRKKKKKNSHDRNNNTNNNNNNTFWCVVDGYVVDATGFLKSHPGGLMKLLSTDSAAIGATGAPFGFSFTRGRNAHLSDTSTRFREGVKRYLSGEGGSGSNGMLSGSEDGRSVEGEQFLPPVEVDFPSYGSIVILGRLYREGGGK